MNIKDIAQLAGVSRATVSRYLNNGYVSDEKKERIKAVIDSTGYVPSTQAQMLRTKRTRLIGVIVPKINSETVARVVDGISQVLAAQKYHMLLANTDNDFEKELDFLNIFANDRVDGVILMASVLTKRHHSLLCRLPVPVVVVGQECSDCCCIYHDDKNASYSLTMKLLERGCRRPTFLGVADDDAAAGLSRRLGFERALKDGGLDPEAITEKVCEFNVDSGYEKMKALLQEDSTIDGVVCATDNIAVGALQALRELGIGVPEQVRLAGFGDTNLASLMTPGITTVHYYYGQSGKDAGQMVMEQIETDTRFIKKVMLGYEIVLRNSL